MLVINLWTNCFFSVLLHFGQPYKQKAAFGRRFIYIVYLQKKEEEDIFNIYMDVRPHMTLTPSGLPQT